MKDSTHAISASCLIVFLGTALGHANGIAPYDSYREWNRDTYALATVVLLVFTLTVFVEYVVIDRLLGRPPKVRGRLALYVLLVNLATNPALQWYYLHFDHTLFRADSPMAIAFPWAAKAARDFLFSWEREYSSSFGYVTALGGEFVVIVLEFLLFRQVFGHLYRCGGLARPVSNGRTLRIVAAANLASYLLVLVTCFMLAELR